MWKVNVAKRAQKAVAGFPVRDQELISSAVQSMATNPFGGDVLKLEGENKRWRRRVGSYRIFFTINKKQKAIEVIAIVRRSTTTY